VTSQAGAQRSRPNSTAAALLGLLLERPMTGWDLIAAAQERIGEFWTITQSQVYRELTAMAARGLVAAGPTGPRDRKPYEVTPAGRAAFADWLENGPGEDQVRIPLLLTIAFAGHLPAGRLAEIIDDRRAVHAERLERYLAGRELLAAAGPGEAARLATLEFGIRHEQAVLDWFDVLPGILAARPS
jgi:DNA-binding PadR family transcriptional regulator